MFSTSPAQSSLPTFNTPVEALSDKGGALECIFGERVASRPWITEWIISFISGDVGSDNSATCSWSLLCQSQDINQNQPGRGY